MYKYFCSKNFQLEINTDSKIGRVLYDTDHIIDITPSTIIVFHPEIFHSIEEVISKTYGFKFEFPDTCNYRFQSKNKIDFHEVLSLIDVFRESCI